MIVTLTHALHAHTQQTNIHNKQTRLYKRTCIYWHIGRFVYLNGKYLIIFHKQMKDNGDFLRKIYLPD